jgi:hypothetical protein
VTVRASRFKEPTLDRTWIHSARLLHSRARHRAVVGYSRSVREVEAIEILWCYISAWSSYTGPAYSRQNDLPEVAVVECSFSKTSSMSWCPSRGFTPFIPSRSGWSHKTRHQQNHSNRPLSQWLEPGKPLCIPTRSRSIPSHYDDQLLAAFCHPLAIHSNCNGCPSACNTSCGPHRSGPSRNSDHQESPIEAPSWNGVPFLQT